MKKIMSILLIVLAMSNMAVADCDYSKIVKNADGTFTYTKELHICVGQMKQDLETVNFQLVEYKKAIDLKDLAIASANSRADLWMNTTFKLQDRMNLIDDMRSKNNLLYFVGGVGLAGLAVWGAGQLR